MILGGFIHPDRTSSGLRASSGSSGLFQVRPQIFKRFRSDLWKATLHFQFVVIKPFCYKFREMLVITCKLHYDFLIPVKVDFFFAQQTFKTNGGNGPNLQLLLFWGCCLSAVQNFYSCIQLLVEMIVVTSIVWKLSFPMVSRANSYWL